MENHDEVDLLDVDEKFPQAVLGVSFGAAAIVLITSEALLHWVKPVTEWLGRFV